MKDFDNDKVHRTVLTPLQVYWQRFSIAFLTTFIIMMMMIVIIIIIINIIIKIIIIIILFPVN